MKILFAIEVPADPFWGRNEYDLVMFDSEKKTSEVITREALPDVERHSCEAHEFYFSDKGLEGQYFACGSGYGKVPIGERFLAIPRSDYDKLVIVESEEKRERERDIDGSWRDNSDFEPGGRMEQLAKAVRQQKALPPNVVEREEYAGWTMGAADFVEKDLRMEIKLKVPVKHVRWNYPFEVTGGGSYNVYPIEEARTWGELLTRIVEVFRREYAAHESEMNHALGDYVIELLDIHPNGSATVCFGS